MSLRTLFFSAAILVTTASAALAAPVNQGRTSDDRDHRAQRADRADDARLGRRDHRVQPTWEVLATLQANSNRTLFKLSRKDSAVDDLRLEVGRGTVNIKKVVVVFTDGSKYVATVDQRLTAGESEVIAIPGAGKRVASVELRYGNAKQRQRSRAQIIVSAR